jgi:uncharacterized protein (TIGR01777 family)
MTPEEIKMKVIIIGGTGFIGTAVVHELNSGGHQTIIVTRSAESARQKGTASAEILEWDAKSPEVLTPALESCDGVVNLAGQSVAVRWTPAVKETLVRSRVDTTRAVVEAIRKAQKKPAVYLQASAIGFYGYRTTEELDESGAPGNDFLADLCRQWESASAELKLLGLRRVIVRIGVVLSPKGGALSRMLLPFKLGLGGPIGSGRQPFSWISLEDAAGAIRFLLENDKAEGVFNLTAPTPVTNAEFARALGRALKRPAFLPTPAFILKILFGEMAEVMLLHGQRVIPKRLIELGYAFRHPDLDRALADLL